MSRPTIEELLTPITGDQMLEKFLSTLESLGLKARSWREGGSLRTILRIVADALAAFIVSMLGFVRAGFLETATAGWLTLLAYYVYGVERIDATFATGQVQVTNSGAGIYDPVPARSFNVINASTGKAYTNVNAFALNPGDVLLIDVVAIELGADSNATPVTVTRLETSLPGVTVTNPAAIVGEDAEKDPDLRQRCKDKLGILSGKGPRGAYAFAIRSAKRADGSSVDVNRYFISPSSSTGIVTIYVASPSGAPTLSDFPFIVDSIETYARPDTVTVDLQAATPIAFSRTLDVWARVTDGVTSSAISDAVSAALLDLITNYPISGLKKTGPNRYLFATTIEGTAKAAHPSIFAIDGAGPDMLLSGGGGKVATLATTVIVHLVNE